MTGFASLLKPLEVIEATEAIVELVATIEVQTVEVAMEQEGQGAIDEVIVGHAKSAQPIEESIEVIGAHSVSEILEDALVDDASHDVELPYATTGEEKIYIDEGAMEHEEQAISIDEEQAVSIDEEQSDNGIDVSEDVFAPEGVFFFYVGGEIFDDNFAQEEAVLKICNDDENYGCEENNIVTLNESNEDKEENDGHEPEGALSLEAEEENPTHGKDYVDATTYCSRRGYTLLFPPRKLQDIEDPVGDNSNNSLNEGTCSWIHTPLQMYSGTKNLVFDRGRPFFYHRVEALFSLSTVAIYQASGRVGLFIQKHMKVKCKHSR